MTAAARCWRGRRRAWLQVVQRELRGCHVRRLAVVSLCLAEGSGCLRSACLKRNAAGGSGARRVLCCSCNDHRARKRHCARSCCSVQVVGLITKACAAQALSLTTRDDVVLLPHRACECRARSRSPAPPPPQRKRRTSSFYCAFHRTFCVCRAPNKPLDRGGRTTRTAHHTAASELCSFAFF